MYQNHLRWVARNKPRFIYYLRYIVFIFSFAITSHHALAYEYITASGIQKSPDFIPKAAQIKPQSTLKVGRVSTGKKITQNSCLRRNKYQMAIERISARYQVDPKLVTAVIAAESCFKPKIVSPKGAEGLMQLMPFTAKRFGVTNSFDPMQNIMGGVKYLRFLLKHFKNDVRLAVAAYNAGEGAVGRYKGVPPYKETRNYVVKVLQMYGNPDLIVRSAQFNSDVQSAKKNKMNIKPAPKRYLSSNYCQASARIRKYTYEVFVGGSVKRFYWRKKGEQLLTVANKTGVGLSQLELLNASGLSSSVLVSQCRS